MRVRSVFMLMIPLSAAFAATSCSSGDERNPLAPSRSVTIENRPANSTVAGWYREGEFFYIDCQSQEMGTVRVYGRLTCPVGWTVKPGSPLFDSSKYRLH